MDIVGGLFNKGPLGGVLGACSVARPRLGLVDWEGAPKDKKMQAALVTQYGAPLKLRSVDLPSELVRVVSP